MGKMISIPFKDSSFPAYQSFHEDNYKRPGLIVIHEVWGLVDHIKEVADRFSKEGYNVLAPDLLSHTGIMESLSPELFKETQYPATKDEAQKKMRAAMTPIQSPEFGKDSVARLKEVVTYLLNDENVNGNVAVVGFCFGGTYSYALAATDDRIKAAIPFYGHAPEPLEKIENINCPVMAFYGEEDEGLVTGLPELKEKMKEYNKDFEFTVYPNTGHAFFNDINPTRYNKEATEDSLKKTLTFLKIHLQ